MRERPSGGKKQEASVEPLGLPWSEIAREMVWMNRAGMELGRVGLFSRIFFHKNMHAWSTKRSLFVKLFLRMGVTFRDEFNDGN